LNMKSKLFRRPTANGQRKTALSRGAHLSPEGHLSSRAAALSALLLLFALPAAAQTPNLRVCANQGFALTSTAAGPTELGPITYTWVDVTKAASPSTVSSGTGTAATLTVPAGSVTAGTYTYLCEVANSACTLSSTYTVEVLEAPVITLSGGAGVQALELPCDTVATMLYSAPGASFAFSGSLPAGVTYTASGASLTIAGKPSAPGAFDYTLTATLGACTATASGSITVIGITATPPGARTERVWCVGGRAWSDAIELRPTACIVYEDGKSTRYDPVYYADDLYTESGYLYNYTCLSAAAAELCPLPWSVPTRTDFCDLDKALFGATTCTNRSASQSDLDKYINEWGGVYGGRARDVNRLYGGEQAIYWSISPIGPSAYTLYLDNQAGAINPGNLGVTEYGIQVRCVKAALGPYIITQPTTTNNEVCEGGTLTLRVVAANATTYQWKKNGVDVTDGTGGTSATYTTGALTANATYTVVVSDGTYSVTSDEAPVIVISYPTTAPTLTASAGTVCEGTAITFTPTGGSNYYWNCSGFTCSYNGATQTTPTTAGTYSAQARTWNNGLRALCYGPYSPVVTVAVLGPGVRGESSKCGCQAPYIRCCSTCVDPDLSYNLSEAERTTDPTVCYRSVGFSYIISDEATCMSKCLDFRSTTHPNLCAYTHEADGSCYCVQNR
jgi:uncharacterized protein (TIGR02145 family)